MTKQRVSIVPVAQQQADGFLFFMQEGAAFDRSLAELSKTYFPHLKAFMKQNKFTGKVGQKLSVAGTSKAGIKHLLFVGIGKKGKSTTIETYRRSVAYGIRLAATARISTVSFSIPAPSFFGCTMHDLARATSLIHLMTDYHFDEFLTAEDAKDFHVKELIIVCAKKDEQVIKKGLTEGDIIGEAVNRARYWVDLPANKITPHTFVARTKKLAKKHNLAITVFNEAQITKMGMGGLKAVGMGSQHDSHLVILNYKCKKKNAPTLALVGKGITFDSGGLNIKPTGYMETMKEDMAGAAAVMNAMTVIAQLKPNVNVVGLAALAENMVSGSANHPGDILTFYNGKTAIVGNTDAEGRLVLADALSYASKHYKPIAMIDLATLTGSVAHAVGPFFSGLLTQNENLAKRVSQAAKTSGDAVWRLPLTEEYKVMVKSDVADICNDGKTKYYAGSTNGACFLSNFVGDTPWVHMDIAAASFNVPDLPYYRTGGTGAGTRLLVDFVMQWK